MEGGKLLFFVALIVSPSWGGEYQEVYTPRELKALTEFRPLVKHLLQKDYEKKDIYLIHWLRAKNLDTSAAKSMLEENMNWRKRNGMDSILEDKEMQALTKLYPCQKGIAKDKVGRPAFQAAFSEWDLRKGYLAGHNFQRYVVYNFEIMTKMAFESGHSHWMFFIEMNQYNLRQHGCLICAQFYIDMVTDYEKYYPNTAKIIYLINTPRVFEGILKIITRLMSPETRNAMKVFGVNKEEWQPEVLKYFDSNQLTKAYGGSLRN